LYPDEGHIPKRPPNQLDYLKRSVEWMEQSLKPVRPE
jgi:dipeptidyl aminopeptidase/acylaminoacyl peptidase